MREHLKLTYWCISQGNHKGNTAEKHLRFLNKNQTITSTDRGSHDKFIQNTKTRQYVWNSAPIDDTDIIVSLPQLEENLYFFLMWKSQQHQPSTLLPIAVSTIISTSYQMMRYLRRRYYKLLSKNAALAIVNVITIISPQPKTSKLETLSKLMFKSNPISTLVLSRSLAIKSVDHSK